MQSRTIAFVLFVILAILGMAMVVNARAAAPWPWPWYNPAHITSGPDASKILYEYIHVNGVGVVDHTQDPNTSYIVHVTYGELTTFYFPSDEVRNNDPPIHSLPQSPYLPPSDDVGSENK